MIEATSNRLAFGAVPADVQRLLASLPDFQRWGAWPRDYAALACGLRNPGYRGA